MDQAAETKNPAEDRKPSQRGCCLSGCHGRQIERCSLMDLLREEAYAFVFRPLTWAEAHPRCFTGGCIETEGCFMWGKSQHRNSQSEGVKLVLLQWYQYITTHMGFL